MLYFYSTLVYWNTSLPSQSRLFCIKLHRDFSLEFWLNIDEFQVTIKLNFWIDGSLVWRKHIHLLITAIIRYFTQLFFDGLRKIVKSIRWNLNRYFYIDCGWNYLQQWVISFGLTQTRIMTNNAVKTGQFVISLGD